MNYTKVLMCYVLQSYQLPKASQPLPTKTVASNSLRDLAYKPSIPQGWNVPAPVFAKGKSLNLLKYTILLLFLLINLKKSIININHLNHFVVQTYLLLQV